MTIPAAFASLAGQWHGTNKLWLDPTAPPAESETALTVATAGQGRFLTAAYTWAYEGQPQDGLLVLWQDPATGGGRLSWLDSFHTGDAVMVFQGHAAVEGRVSVLGSYAAPSGPDWGWQIDLASLPPGGLQIIMHNITPDGEAFPAVEATYTRAA